MRNQVKRILKLFRSAESRKKDFGKAAARFIEQNPGSFVLLCDPDTDVMVAAYNNIMVPVHMKQPDGKRMHIVRNALKYSKEEKSVDQFLLVVDSMLVNIAKENDNKRSKGMLTRAREFVLGDLKRTPKGIKSPLQPVRLKK